MKSLTENQISRFRELSFKEYRNGELLNNIEKQELQNLYKFLNLGDLY